MKRLDRSRAFGNVVPPFQDDDMDRPALYEQGGSLFDAHDIEIIPGTSLEAMRERDKAAQRPQAASPKAGNPLDHDGDGKPGGSKPAGNPDPTLTAAQLLALADDLNWHKFKKQAELLIGADKCPAKKAEILEVLEDMKADDEAEPDEDEAPETQTPAAEMAIPPAATQPQQSAGDEINLSAWARGQTDYLFGDVRKAIKARYSKVVNTSMDAVVFLVEQGVVPAKAARTDVQGVQMRSERSDD